ncbi:PaaI family thioesterase [Nocardia alni]|uniref:PaaI family thioesterase n=1 Tax=Nocardia alni TaxID=2815723 RepID=UPI001C24213E|nr:PaaI family thioesterase [Nocardia alni]
MNPPSHVAHRPQPTETDWGAWQNWARTQPAIVALGLEPREFGDGRAVFDLAESILPLNPNGAVNGGLVAAVADQVGAMAAVTCAAPGHGVLTCVLNTEYLAPARLPLVCVGTVVRSGSALIFVHIEIDSGGRLCSAASGTWLPRPYTEAMS